MDGTTRSLSLFPPADSENGHQLDCSNGIPVEDQAPECSSLHPIGQPISDYQRNRLAALKKAKSEMEAAIRGQHAIVEDISEILRRKEAELAAVKERVEALDSCKAGIRSDEVILKAVVNNLCLCYALAQLSNQQM